VNNPVSNHTQFGVIVNYTNKDTNIQMNTNDTNGNECYRLSSVFVLIRIIRGNSYISIFIRVLLYIHDAQWSQNRIFGTPRN
jgi:hypothetical protein